MSERPTSEGHLRSRPLLAETKLMAPAKETVVKDEKHRIEPCQIILRSHWPPEVIAITHGQICTSSGGSSSKDGYVWGPIYEQRWCSAAICKAVPASAAVGKRYCHQ
jgi:hypothetical protein